MAAEEFFNYIELPQILKREGGYQIFVYFLLLKPFF